MFFIATSENPGRGNRENVPEELVRCTPEIGIDGRQAILSPKHESREW